MSSIKKENKMKKNWLSVLTISSLFVAFIFVVFVAEKPNNNQKLENKIIEPKIEKKEIKEDEQKIKMIVVDYDHLQTENVDQEEEKIAYAIGYTNGQNAIYSQMKDSIRVVLKDDEKYKYTINKYEGKIDERLQEIIDKGYIDGYHKASEYYYCPRAIKY